MEIYVDKLPKSCFECPCFQNDIECCCGLDDGTNDYFKDDIDGGECPLKNIKDYNMEKDKRIKELLQENQQLKQQLHDLVK